MMISAYITITTSVPLSDEPVIDLTKKSLKPDDSSNSGITQQHSGNHPDDPNRDSTRNLDTELHQKLASISRTYDIDYLLALRTDPVLRARYYRADTVQTPLFHNSKASSSRPPLKEPAGLESFWYVDQYLKLHPTKKVLELGVGINGDSILLALQYPDVAFYRLHSFQPKLLHELQRYRGLHNFHSLLGQYDKQPYFDDNMFGIVFSVESLSLCERREDTLKEVYRILQKDGYFIVVDGYLGKGPGALNRDELMARHLVGRGKALKEFETYDDFVDKVKITGFTIAKEIDVSEKVIRGLKRHELPARFFFSSYPLSKLVSIVASSDFAYSMISNYLITTAMRLGIAQYMVTIMKK